MNLYYYVKKTDLGDLLPGHNDSRTSKMKIRPRNGRKQPRKGVKVSESESKRPEKNFLHRLHSCTHEQEWENRKILAPQCDPLTVFSYGMSKSCHTIWEGKDHWACTLWTIILCHWESPGKEWQGCPQNFLNDPEQYDFWGAAIIMARQKITQISFFNLVV